MTDSPKTLSIDAAEWKALLLDNLARAHQAVANSQGINPAGLVDLGQHLDRVKVLAAAWHASLPKAQPVAQDDPVTTPAAANGSAEPKKRRGGWPAGKPRKPRTAQAVQ